MKRNKQFPNKARCQSTGFAHTITTYYFSFIKKSKQRTTHAFRQTFGSYCFNLWPKCWLGRVWLSFKRHQSKRNTDCLFKNEFGASENTDELHEKLAIYLGASGVQLSNGSDAYVLRVLDYKPQRLELNGKLIEVLLRLNVTFRIEDAQGRPITEPRTVVATRSYQYNVETVNTDDQEKNYLYQVIVDDVAQQIVRQISSNRLPPAQQ